MHALSCLNVAFSYISWAAIDPVVSMHSYVSLVYAAVQVMQMPEQVEAHGRGPLISAKLVDMNVFWKRCNQIAELSIQVLLHIVLGITDVQHRQSTIDYEHPAASWPSP